MSVLQAFCFTSFTNVDPSLNLYGCTSTQNLKCIPSIYYDYLYFCMSVMERLRKIIHIDMDAFYAAVEQRDNPGLRGRPIVVGHDGPRGVVATASYEARRYGIRSAMPSVTARRRCPHLIFVPGRMDVYKEVSASIHDIFHEYTDIVEPLSLDEAFLDVTDNKAGMELAVEIAREIKDKIRQRLHLVASAGVSYNKFLAKIASDYRKPDGLCTIHPSRAMEFIDAMEIERFWGVGPVTARRMHDLGIHNGFQLRQRTLQELTDEFGKSGVIYYNFARGIDDRPVSPERERKSVGCEETFDHDVSDYREMESLLMLLIQDLSGRLARRNFMGHTLTLKVKFHDFTQITRSITIPDVFDSDAKLTEYTLRLAKSVDCASYPVRLLGLSVHNAQTSPIALHTEGRQLTIDFGDGGLSPW